MSPLGPYLRELRERRGVSLDEISRTTRVGRAYLEALESGNLSQLPAPVFARGFVVSYCQALGVSADEALSHFDRRAARTDEPAPATPPAATLRRDRSEARGRGSVLVSFILVVILGAALFALAFVLQSGRDGGERRAVPPTSTPAPESAPARVDQVESPPAEPPQRAVSGATAEPPATPPTVTGVARPPTQTLPPVVSVQTVVAPEARSQPSPRVAPGVPGPSASLPSPDAGAPARATPPPGVAVTQQDVTAAIGAVTAPYRLLARATANTWIRVRTDDGRQSDETIPAGQVREWVSNRPFTISIGNAGGISLELNGRALPPLGPSGTVIGRLVLPGETP